MKNLFKIYLVVWFVIALIYNVVAFATHGAIGEFYKYNALFFENLIIVDVAFILQLFFTKFMIKNSPNTHNDSLAELSATAKNAGFLVLIMLCCVSLVLFPVIPSFVVPVTAYALLVINVLVITLSSKKFKMFLKSLFDFLNKKTIKFIALPIAVIILISATIIPSTVIPSFHYKNALKHIEDNNFHAACSSLAKAKNYKDSNDKLNSLISKDSSLEIYNAQIGDTVIFGKYEQDADSENGYEPLEWTVLDRKGNKVLLISSYCIEKIPYHNTLTDITWDKCSLRTWLNSKFIELAFNEQEASMLAKTRLSNNKNPVYKAPQSGKATTDKVFVLSYYEAKHYLNSDALINVKATKTVKELRAHVNSQTGYAWWWLRSPGSANTSAMTNHFQKQFSNMGYQVNHESYTVRPSIWVEL